jgi:hypothetical protein
MMNDDRINENGTKVAGQRGDGENAARPQNSTAATGDEGGEKRRSRC